MTKKTALIYTSISFLLIATAYLLQLRGMSHPQLTGTLFLFPPAIAVGSGLYAVSVYRLSSAHGRVLAYLTAGLSCWLIGEAIFYAFQFIFHINPFPSVADVFYIAAYPLLMFGLSKEITLHGHDWRNLRGSNKLVVILISLLVACLAFIVCYFGVFRAYQPGASGLANSIAIGYGIGDLILLIPVLFIMKMVLDFRGGQLFYSWLLILIALFFVMAGDILFAVFNKQYQALEPAYSLIDLAWVAGYLSFAYSFFFTAETIRTVRLSLREEQGS